MDLRQAHKEQSRPQKGHRVQCAETAVLVVYSLSRLSRSTRDSLIVADKLHKAGTDLFSLSERIDIITAAGKMVLRMLAVLKECECDQIGVMTMSATGGGVQMRVDHRNS